MITRLELYNFFNELLLPDSFNDFCPNGLQVTGNETIHKITFAVSATIDSINKCVFNKTDALVVHHGVFWDFHGVKPITGTFGERITNLIRNNINLFSYHLPLDAHLTIGNASIIGSKLGIINPTSFGDYKGSPTGIKGEMSEPMKVFQLEEKLRSLLNHNIIVASSDKNKIIQRVGIITGGASGDWAIAKSQNLDAFVTGEIHHYDWIDSIEAGIHMFAGGHEATERFGIMELMKATYEKFGDSVECGFIESDNPV